MMSRNDFDIGKLTGLLEGIDRRLSSIEKSVENLKHESSWRKGVAAALGFAGGIVSGVITYVVKNTSG